MSTQNTRNVKNTTKVTRSKILADNLINIVHPEIRLYRNGEREIYNCLADYSEEYAKKSVINKEYKRLIKADSVGCNRSQKNYIKNLYEFIKNGAFLFCEYMGSNDAMNFFEKEWHKFNVNHLYDVSLFYTIRDMDEILRIKNLELDDVKYITSVFDHYMNVFKRLNERNACFHPDYPDYLKYVFLPNIAPGRVIYSDLTITIPSCISQNEFEKQYPYYAFYHQAIKAYTRHIYSNACIF